MAVAVVMALLLWLLLLLSHRIDSPGELLGCQWSQATPFTLLLLLLLSDSTSVVVVVPLRLLLINSGPQLRLSRSIQPELSELLDDSSGDEAVVAT